VAAPGGCGLVAAAGGGCQRTSRLGLAEARKKSGSDYHVKGEGLQ
jgi:hypothetical protein